MACFLFFMGSLKYSLSAYVRHRMAVQSKYTLHSPFIYQFWSKVLKTPYRFSDYKTVEKTRAEMLKDERLINRLDYGAGSRGPGMPSKHFRVSALARRSLVSRQKGELLYRIVHFYKPMNILEFGTSLGLSALYMAAAMPVARIVSMEGCPETAAIAISNFEKAGRKNITVLTGTFDEKLPDALGLLPKIDLVFFDGNHRPGPTLKYWEACLPRLHAGSIAVFDDIHWSAGMEKAWKTIISRPEVKVSIDLFDPGILFFREELSKEDFVLRF